MMDGRVGNIRAALDEVGHSGTAIMSYAVKSASSFYGPFREAAQSAPRHGDRRSYQMDFANGLEAIREARLDVGEGADIIMVKPAGPSLDLISRVKGDTGYPLAAYQVSGEYAMIRAAAERGWVNGDEVMLESLYAIRRAGADIIITYFAVSAAEALRR
jgi:porphobilinogen synthase